ncbi:hypothetical protein CsSME_00044545 [Camellia sinensis var. sinensis]
MAVFRLVEWCYGNKCMTCQSLVMSSRCQNGLKWYAKRLKIDEEGDVADEFLDEILPEPTSASDMVDQHRPFPRFEVKFVARPAKVRKQALAADGKIQQGVEYQGKLQWV